MRNSLRVSPLRRFHVAILFLFSLSLMIVSSAASAVDVNRDCAALYGTSFTASTGQVAASVPSMARPLKGVRQKDPNFGTCMFRATDHAVEPPTSYARNDYARRQAFNADNSLFIVYASGGGWHLYNAVTLAYIKQLSFSGINEPQWHATDPKSLYFLPNKGGMTISKLNVDTNTSTVVANFSSRLPWSGATYAWTAGEGSPSADGRYWCLMAENSSRGILGVFTYDLTTNTILGTKTLSSKPNHVSMSPSGRWCVVSGTTAYSRNFSTSKTLLSGSQHNDLALGADGQDYYVFVNQAVDGYLTMKSIDTGVATRLIPTWIDGTTTSGHISGKAFSRPGWILYSTFNHSGSLKWSHERVLAVEMKASPKIISLAHHHEYYNGYWTQPHASVSRDFSRVVFNSNWGSTSSTDVDTYMLRLADNTLGTPVTATPTPTPGTGDTIAPYPTASVSVATGSITMSASATDNVGVAKIEFYIDGIYKGYDATAAYNMTLNTSTWAPGSAHTLVVRAYDAAGNVRNSATVPFTIGTGSTDTIAPYVTASVSVATGSITMMASATDNVGVAKVEFYIDGVYKGYDSTSAFSMYWNTSTWWPGSSHTLVVRAYDKAGNVRNSATVPFTIGTGSTSTADTIAPYPTASVSVATGSITMMASATDNVGVAKIEFYIDGVYKGYDATAAYNMTLNTSTWAPGSSHTLVVRAYDKAGNVRNSATVPFTIGTGSTSSADTIAPYVTASVSVATGSITMKASATDNVGVAKVEFYIDGVIKGYDTTSAYSLYWNTSSWWPGSTHTLVVRAYDKAGNVRNSAPVSFKRY